MLLMTGVAALAAATRVPVPPASASPAGRVPPPSAPPAAAAGAYIFQDEFDGPAGSAPDPGKWTVQNWDDDVFPPVLGHYRDDRRNVFLDGNSNLVLLATHEDDQYFSGKLLGNWRGLIGHTWEARIKLDCLTPGAWPAVWTVNQDPVPDGMATDFGLPEPRSTQHPTGKHGKGNRSPGWWTVGGTAGECFGTRTVSNSGGITLTARNPISVCRRNPYRSTTDPARRGGRSTNPAIGCLPCSPLPSVGRAAAIPPSVTSRRLCSSTGYVSGRHLRA
jgi:hypothetical protein